MASLAEKEWLTVGEVARVLGWNIQAVRARFDAGHFKNTMVKNKYRYVHRDEIIAQLARQGGGKHGTRE